MTLMEPVQEKYYVRCLLLIVQRLGLLEVKNNNLCDLKLDKTLHGEIRESRESIRTLFFGANFFTYILKFIVYF
jgi:hypothetical protein